MAVQSEHEDQVDDSSLVVSQHSVKAASGCESLHLVGRQAVQQINGVLAGDSQSTHGRSVDKTYPFPDGVVLVFER